VQDYLARFQFHDEENIEPFETENIGGEEIAGEKGFPLGSKETLP
jgi:hypothetical protein